MLLSYNCGALFFPFLLYSRTDSSTVVTNSRAKTALTKAKRIVEQNGRVDRITCDLERANALRGSQSVEGPFNQEELNSVGVTIEACEFQLLLMH